MIKFLSFLIVLIGLSGITIAQTQEPLADNLTDKLKSDYFNFSLLLQSEGVFSFEDNDFMGGRQFDMGATRIDIRGDVDGGFTYRFQGDFRRQVTVLDAQVGYRFNPNHRIVAGAFKPFLSIELDPNPGNTLFMNRARQVGAMMNSREIGVTLLGQESGFNYRIGVYNGTGLDRTNDNNFMFTARLGYDFDLGNNSTLGLGINSMLNQTENHRVGNTGQRSEGDRLLYGGFLKYDSPGLFGEFELLVTTFDSTIFDGNEETVLGFVGTLGYNLNEKNQLLARWDHLETDLMNESSELFILGWNHQATRLISFQVNIMAQIEDGMDDQFGIAGVMQFQF